MPCTVCRGHSQAESKSQCQLLVVVLPWKTGDGGFEAPSYCLALFLSTTSLPSPQNEEKQTGLFIDSSGVVWGGVSKVGEGMR